MMKKYLVVLLLAGCSHVALAAPQTFDEAYKVLTNEASKSFTEKASKNHFENALQAANQALNLAETVEQKASVQVWIGDIKSRQGDIASARDEYNSVSQLPNLKAEKKADALIRLANTYILQKPSDYAQARATFERISKGDEFSEQDKADAQLRIASVYSTEGDYARSGAQSQLIAQNTKAPKWARIAALQFLADSQSMQKNYASARESYQELLATSSYIRDEIRARDGIARSYIAEGNYQQARREFTKILQLKTADVANLDISTLQIAQANSQMFIGLCYISEKDFNQARQELNKVSDMPWGYKYFNDRVKFALEQIDKQPEFANAN